jgi:N4-gp56 family major capsid protein
MQTQIPFGHPLARKVFGAAFFAEYTRKQTFMSRLSGPAPTIGSERSKMERMQTSPDYPCVRVTDLSKQRGDTVSVDLFNLLQGKPVMGDKKLAGKMMRLTSSSMDIKINQVRGGMDPGGRMSQQRTVHDLRTIGRGNLMGWWMRFIDQWKYVHLAGARGSMNTADWVIPLADDPDFAEIMVNSVKAPTYNRHFYGGDATDIESLDTSDILTLDDIDMLRAAIDEADNPLQPIVLPDDPASQDEPLYLLIVSNRQWHYLQTRTGEKAWRTFLSNARERSSKNPLFSGEPGMWNGILVRKTSRAIRFFPGDSVTVAKNQDDFDTESKTVPALDTDYAVDRAILLGAQAIAEVWGKDSQSETFMRWWEETTDHGNTYEASVAGMGGLSKLRFTNTNGMETDHGVMALDTVAPDPRTVRIV